MWAVMLAVLEIYVGPVVLFNIDSTEMLVGTLNTIRQYIKPETYNVLWFGLMQKDYASFKQHLAYLDAQPYPVVIRELRALDLSVGDNRQMDSLITTATKNWQLNHGKYCKLYKVKISQSRIAAQPGRPDTSRRHQ